MRPAAHSIEFRTSMRKDGLRCVSREAPAGCTPPLPLDARRSTRCWIAAAVSGLQQRSHFCRLPHVPVDLLIGERERCDIAENGCFPAGRTSSLSAVDTGEIPATLVVEHEKPTVTSSYHHGSPDCRRANVAAARIRGLPRRLTRERARGLRQFIDRSAPARHNRICGRRSAPTVVGWLVAFGAAPSAPRRRRGLHFVEAAEASAGCREARADR